MKYFETVHPKHSTPTTPMGPMYHEKDIPPLALSKVKNLHNHPVSNDLGLTLHDKMIEMNCEMRGIFFQKNLYFYSSKFPEVCVMRCKHL